MGKGRGDAHKKKRSAKNRQQNKYRKFFIRTVKKTGRWRGKKKSLVDLKK